MNETREGKDSIHVARAVDAAAGLQFIRRELEKSSVRLYPTLKHARTAHLRQQSIDRAASIIPVIVGPSIENPHGYDATVDIPRAKCAGDITIRHGHSQPVSPVPSLASQADVAQFSYTR
jgi:hypothetical protein